MRSIFLFLLLLQAFGATEIFLDYSSYNQEQHLIKLFSDSYDQFYADLGAYDPLIFSNTINFYARGWKGVNVQAHPVRASRFLTARPSTITLNMAVANQQKFVTLMELTNDSSSTISQQYLQFMKKDNQFLKETSRVNIPSISMQQICQRYFYRRPILISIDIQGFQGEGLKGNNWTNPSCRPDVFIIEIFDQKIDQNGTRYGQELPQKILSQNGYKKLQGNFPHNQIFIQTSVFPVYDKRFKQFNYSKYNIVKYYTLKSVIYSHFAMSPGAIHYKPETDRLFFYISVVGEPVIPSQLNQFSNTVRGQANRQNKDLQDRNIIILQFNVQKTQIFLKDHELIRFDEFEIKININFHFWHFQFGKIDKEGQKKSYHMYILDHQMQRANYPRVISRDAGILNYVNKSSENSTEKANQVQQPKQQVNSKKENTTESKGSQVSKAQSKQQIEANKIKIQSNQTQSPVKKEQLEKQSHSQQIRVVYSEFDQSKFKKAEQQRRKLLEQVGQLKRLIISKKQQLNSIQKNETNIVMMIYVVILMLGVLMLANCIFCLFRKQLSSKRSRSQTANSFQELQQVQ